MWDIVSLSSQESNINSTDDIVKKEVSILSANQIYMKWEEDENVLKQQKDMIQVLLENNHWMLSMISSLKIELKVLSLNFEALTKFVRILSFGT